ncbi:MAG: RdgB/HAM1 family non-canonical purine NTP pyrophosphatase [Lachnospiraceae bacterium]|nr:RdgB/HAM1 family non-canonical purine NTP pyrophosphatase [Lachnospiraceae bacterium]
MRLVFATGNQGKMREIREIMEDSGYEIISMKEAGIDIDITEDGTTFEENALIKARAVSKLLPDDLVLADDSGLEVDALNKEPGIYSARYLGHDTPYSIKNADIIRRLEGKEGAERSARFVCAIAAVFPDGTEKCVRATIEGQIDYEEKGEHGFGFDPIFYVPELGCTTAEIPETEKNKISHRGKALKLMRRELLEHESTNRQ